MPSGIYSITNSVNGKVYYGSSVNMESRKRQHWSDLRNGKHKNPHLQAAWNKYGGEAFRFDVVQIVLEGSLVDIEQGYIDANEGGYNIGKFAYAPARGRKKSPDEIAKMSASRKGRKLSESHKKALSVAGMNRKVGETTRSKLSAANKGKRHSDETKSKISETGRNKWSDGNYRERQVAAQRTGNNTPTAKANRSAAMTTRWQDAAQREAMSAERKSRWHNPEYRAMMLKKRQIQGQQLRERNRQQKEK